MEKKRNILSHHRDIRKFSRKLAVWMLAAGLLITLCTACASRKNSWKVSMPAHVEGAVFGGKSDDSIPVTVDFDVDWITKEDNTGYSSKLAAFAALLSADAYFREKDLGKGTPNRLLFDDANPDDYTFTEALTKLGFTDVKHVESNTEKTYSEDPDDSIIMNMGYRHVSSEYDVYVVVLRGCYSAGEWMSAFDPGADSDSYEELTGNHPEWTNKKVLKGFDVAANRACDIINEFIVSHENPAAQTCILLTGHSRGGAIAEVIGARLEDEKKVKSFTYTFNSPSVTTEETAADYQTIFNVFDSGDLLRDVMTFSEEKTYRYGRTVEKDIIGSADILETLGKLKGRDDFLNMGPDLREKYRELFGTCFTDRASLYEKKSFTEEFDDEASASERKTELSSIISKESGFGLENYCIVRDPEITETGKYALTVDYCDAATLFSISKILTYGKTAYDAVISFYQGDTNVCALADFIMANALAIKSGHSLVNSYAICETR